MELETAVELPDELQELGPLRATFRGSTAGTFVLQAILGLLGLLGGGIVIGSLVFLVWNDGREALATMIPLTFGGLIFGLAVLYYLRDRAYRHHEVLLFRDGFATCRSDSYQVFRWDEIEAVWQKSVTHTMSVYGVPVGEIGTVSTYTVRRTDGEVVKFNNVLENVAELGEAIQQETLNRQWPALIAVFNEGDTVQFGPLSLNREGIGYGRDVLPWAKVRNVSLNSGWFLVYSTERRRRWCAVPVGQVPNWRVLWEMLNRALSNRNS